MENVKIRRIGFSVNLYDRDGYCWEECILLHQDNGCILQFNTVRELEDHAKRIFAMLPEIREALDELKPTSEDE